jgi:hypothetical protein
MITESNSDNVPACFERFKGWSHKKFWRVTCIWKSDGDIWTDSPAYGDTEEDAKYYWHYGGGHGRSGDQMFISIRFDSYNYNCTTWTQEELQQIFARQKQQKLKAKTMTDVEWADKVKCDDTATGRIGLFTLLRLVAEASEGRKTGEYTVFDSSSLVAALKEADPQMRHWHMIVRNCRTPDGKHNVVSIYRRKEWNESYEKAIADEKNKEILYASEAEYQADKAAVMSVLLTITSGNRRAAEALFAPLANDRKKLKERADALRKMKMT